VSQGERHVALSGKLASAEAAPALDIAIDGTGVPVVARETEGRKGKQNPERAKTREAKLGGVFTQTRLDDQGHPRGDEQSTTYVGAIETAEQFWPRIYAEAVRRGLKRAGRVIVVGDGAAWIWNISDEHFYDAIQIIDLYHARQHLTELAKSVYGQATTKANDWAAGRSQQLDEGNIEAVPSALRRRRPRDEPAQKAVHRTLHYFQSKAKRMRYADFRSQSLFVGSGVVEAGCKTAIGHRLQQSGMQ